jgi:Heterokaryon incompatibility protein (HET)
VSALQIPFKHRAEGKVRLDTDSIRDFTPFSREFAGQTILMDCLQSFDQINPAVDPAPEALCQACKMRVGAELEYAQYTQNCLLRFPDEWHPMDRVLAGYQRAAKNGCHLCNIVISGLSARYPSDVQRPTTPVMMSACIKRITDRGSAIYTLRFCISARPRAKYLELELLPVEGQSSMNILTATSADTLSDAQESRRLNIQRTPTFNTFSKTTIDLVKEWLQHCLTHHEDCHRKAPQHDERGALPSRLLKIIDTEAEPSLRVVPSAKLSNDTQYVALSHCWGHKCKIILTRDNLEAFEAAIPYAALPKTFVDAVFATRKLGLSYLWIDSMCILQDSPEDWARESARMAAVYSNSTVTFAATASSNGEGGLFFSRDTCSTFPCTIQHIWNTGAKSLFVCYPSEEWDFRIKKAALGQRAWTFQERLLSKRVLHFCDDQVRWECSASIASEAFPKGVPVCQATTLQPGDLWLMNLINKDSETLSRRWALVRELYSGGSLTFQSDRLNALSGLAHYFIASLGLTEADYLAGLWRQDLENELLWTCSSTSPRLACPEYCAPSWSWAQVTGAISFSKYERLQTFFEHRQRERVPISHVHFVDVKTFPVHVDNPFGQVSGGYILVRGLLCFKQMGPPPKNVVPRPDSIPTLDLKFRTIQDAHYTSLQIILSFDEAAMERKGFGGSWIHIIPISTHWRLQRSIGGKWQSKPALKGLILEKTGRSVGQYRRLGVFTVFDVLPMQILTQRPQPYNLPKDDYREFDGVSQYTIEIV